VKHESRVAGGQDNEVRYTAKKTKRSADAKEVKKVAAAASGSRIGSAVRNANEAGGLKRYRTFPQGAMYLPGRVSAPPLETLLACKHTVKVLAHNN